MLPKARRAEIPQGEGAPVEEAFFLFVSPMCPHQNAQQDGGGGFGVQNPTWGWILFKNYSHLQHYCPSVCSGGEGTEDMAKHRTHSRDLASLQKLLSALKTLGHSCSRVGLLLASRGRELLGPAGSRGSGADLKPPSWHSPRGS